MVAGGRITKAKAERQSGAFVALALHGLENQEEATRAFLDTFGGPEPIGRTEAFELLANSIIKGELVPPRLVVLDALVKQAVRDPSVVDDNALPVLIEALVRTAPGEIDDIDFAVRLMIDALRPLRDFDDQDAAWEAYAGATMQVMSYSTAEYSSVQCNDGGILRSKTGVSAPLVVASYEAPGVVSQYFNLLDPRKWPTCTLYFKGMDPIIPPGVVNTTVPKGWKGDLMEKIQLNGTLLKTPLRFTFKDETNTVRKRATTDYNLIQPTDKILVDQGLLSVQQKLPNRVYVSLGKAIRWKSELEKSWPTIACDLFWKPLAIAMAVGCSTN